MTFKMDENLPVEAADLLRAEGYDTQTVMEEELAGTDDPELAVQVQTEGRALVTLDRGFGDIRAYPPFGLSWHHCHSSKTTG